jgi:hypothetical protein
VTFPGYDSLFTVRDPLGTRAYRATLDGDLPTEGHPTALLRGEASSNRLVATRQMGSRTPGDVMWTSWGNVLLLSERVVQKLREADISGWSTLPAVVEGAEGPLPYRFLVVTGRCGPLDFTRSS